MKKWICVARAVSAAAWLLVPASAVAQIGQPALASPPNGATDQPTTLVLEWQPSGVNLSYRVQVATDNTFGTLVFEDVTAGTSRQVSSLQNSTTYFWRVRGEGILVTGPWSDTWTFTTIPAPEVPTLVSPANGSRLQPTVLSLMWNTSFSATGYRVQVSNEASFSSPFVDASIPDTFYGLTGLSSFLSVFWRVRATNIGGTSAWSQAWEFRTTGPPPTVRTDTATVHDAARATVRGIVNPNGSEAIVLFQYGPTTDYGSEITAQQSPVGGSLDEAVDALLGNLSSGTTYHVRVVATNEAGSGTGADQTFTTASVPLPRAQRVALAAGWNMISSYIDPPDRAVDILCDRIRPNMVLMKDDNGRVYWPSIGHNSIGEWNPERGYQIYMQMNDTMLITGTEIIPELTMLSLADRWNIVSYLRTTSLNIETAVASIAGALVAVKNNTGDVYWPAYSINTIGSMKPGDGYQMFLSQPAQLVYPSNANGASGSPSPPVAAIPERRRSLQHFQCTTSTGNNATIAVPMSANPSVDGIALVSGDEIGVFTPSGLCVGWIVWTESNNAITVWGDNDQTAEIDGILAGERMHYRVWKQSSDREFQNVAVTYSQGDGMYSPNGIYVLSSMAASSATSIDRPSDVPSEFFVNQNYPNPFNPSTIITYGLPRPAKVRLVVFNMIGQQVATLADGQQSPGTHAVRFEGVGLPAGVYTYRLEADESVVIRKMILLR